MTIHINPARGEIIPLGLNNDETDESSLVIFDKDMIGKSADEMLIMANSSIWTIAMNPDSVGCRANALTDLAG